MTLARQATDFGVANRPDSLRLPVTASIESILRTELGLGKCQTAFITTLLRLMIALPGRATFRNLARFAPYHERTFRRHFDKAVNWTRLNLVLARPVLTDTRQIILAIDCSFVPKSGRHTYGLDTFWNGVHSRSERGLDVSLLALVEPKTKRAFALSAQQTAARAQSEGDSDQATASRTKQYLAHLQAAAPEWPKSVRYTAADGYYTKRTFIDGVGELDLHLIGKLRSDAHLRHLYTRPRTGKRGRPRRYAGQVDLGKPEQLTYVTELEPGVRLYTAKVNHKRFKRTIRLAYVQDVRVPDRPRRKLLCSTDTKLNAEDVVQLYRARFQIEFLFRDAKQYTGLSGAQARSWKRLAFHFSASFAALNLARSEAHAAQDEDKAKGRGEGVCRVFSMASAKRRGYNALYLDRIMRALAVRAEGVLNREVYERLCNFGAVAA